MEKESVLNYEAVKGDAVEYYTMWIIVFVISLIAVGYSYFVKPLPFMLGVVSLLLSVFSFLKLFFVGAGKPDKIRRRCNASQVLLLTIFFGGSVVLVVASLAYIYKLSNNDLESILAGTNLTEEEFGTVFFIILSLWVLSIVLAIINKIQVNVHNQI